MDEAAEPDGSLEGGDEIATPHDDVAEGRDRRAEGRDAVANARDAAADDRDRAAEGADATGIDRSPEEPGTESGRVPAARPPDRVTGAPAAAVSDRTAASWNRVAAKADRAEAAHDRYAAAADRGASARERAAASLDELTGAHRRGAGFMELDREVAELVGPISRSCSPSST